MKALICFGLFAGLAVLATTQTEAQIMPASDPAQAEILRKGEIVAGNVQKAIELHVIDDPLFGSKKQLPEDKRAMPSILATKDGILMDWTPGQESRYLMEQLRQGIHALQSADKPRGFDVIALTGARELWPQLRDISCHETHGLKYYDLDGFQQFCPDK